MNVEPFGLLNAEMIRGSLKNQIILDTSEILYQHCILPSRKVITEPSNLSYVVMHQMSY